MNTVDASVVVACRCASRTHVATPTRLWHLTHTSPKPSVQYHYHSLAPRGSGEFALRHVLAPFAWPHAPLEERMAELDVPVTFI